VVLVGLHTHREMALLALIQYSAQSLPLVVDLAQAIKAARLELVVQEVQAVAVAGKLLEPAVQEIHHQLHRLKAATVEPHQPLVCMLEEAAGVALVQLAQMVLVLAAVMVALELHLHFPVHPLLMPVVVVVDVVFRVLLEPGVLVVAVMEAPLL